jgi:hypothetical protein
MLALSEKALLQPLRFGTEPICLSFLWLSYTSTAQTTPNVHCLLLTMFGNQILDMLGGGLHALNIYRVCELPLISKSVQAREDHSVWPLRVTYHCCVVHKARLAGCIALLFIQLDETLCSVSANADCVMLFCIIELQQHACTIFQFQRH